MNRPICLVLGIAVLGLGSSGCSQRIADFTAISTKNIYAKGVDVSALPKVSGVKGRHITFLGLGANIKDAIDQALEKGDGNLMIDCAVYIWHAPFVGGYEVRGTVVKVPYEGQVQEKRAEASEFDKQAQPKAQSPPNRTLQKEAQPAKETRERESRPKDPLIGGRSESP